MPYLLSHGNPDTDVPTDYAVQRYRFVVKEGFGCTSSHPHSILSILLIEGWLVVAPLLSVLLYYRESSQAETSNFCLRVMF